MHVNIKYICTFARPTAYTCIYTDTCTLVHVLTHDILLCPYWLANAGKPMRLPGNILAHVCVMWHDVNIKRIMPEALGDMWYVRIFSFFFFFLFTWVDERLRILLLPRFAIYLNSETVGWILSGWQNGEEREGDNEDYAIADWVLCFHSSHVVYKRMCGSSSRESKTGHPNSI